MAKETRPVKYTKKDNIKPFQLSRTDEAHVQVSTCEQIIHRCCSVSDGIGQEDKPPICYVTKSIMDTDTIISYQVDIKTESSFGLKLFQRQSVNRWTGQDNENLHGRRKTLYRK